MKAMRIATPELASRIDRRVLISTLARLLASETASSRPELVLATGLSRTTVDAGIRTLLELGVVRTAGYQQQGGRGRAAAILELNPDFGYVLVADCGRHSAQLNVFDFRQQSVGSSIIPIEFTQGPESVLQAIVSGLKQILTKLPHHPLVAVVGVPAPVDHRGGSVVRPPFMPGWDRYPVAQHLSDALGCNVILENDVNLRALGEARSRSEFRGPLLYVKVGTGLGAGIVTAEGELLRGADGSSGELAHMKVNGQNKPCVCGAQGCLETVASVGALSRTIRGADPATPTSGEQYSDFFMLLAQGDPTVRASVREAAIHLGEAVANLVHIINPHQVVLGGKLVAADDELLATVRSIVYQQALPISTRELILVEPFLGSESGIGGGLALGIEQILSPDYLGEGPEAGA